MSITRTELNGKIILKSATSWGSIRQIAGGPWHVHTAGKPNQTGLTPCQSGYCFHDTDDEAIACLTDTLTEGSKK